MSSQQSTSRNNSVCNRTTSSSVPESLFSLQTDGLLRTTTGPAALPTPDRPMSLRELLPLMSIELLMHREAAGDASLIAHQRQVDDNASGTRRDHLLAIIDSALAITDEDGSQNDNERATTGREQTRRGSPGTALQ